jgi:hypothetical protein
MNTLKQLVVLCLVASLMLSGRYAVAIDALDDSFTQISPNNASAYEKDEFFHGVRHGKILMRVLLLGAIQHPGVHYFAEGTDLLFACTYAGGTTEFSKPSAITIRRRGVKNLIEVDLEELIQEGAPIPKLLDGDLIQVPFNWKRDYATLTFYIGVFTTMTSLMLVILSFTRSTTYTGGVATH